MDKAFSLDLFLFALLLAWGCLVERFNLILYLWCHYLFIWLFCKLFIYWIIYSSSWLSLHYSWLNLRLLHQDAALLQCWVATSSQTRILNLPLGLFFVEVKEVEKWSWKLAINIQTVVIPERGWMINLMTNTESPFDWSY